MNSDDRIHALLMIQEQLQQWVAYAPEWYVQLHGMQAANIGLQRVKQLIVYELQVQALEDVGELNQSMGIHNEL